MVDAHVIVLTDYVMCNRFLASRLGTAIGTRNTLIDALFSERRCGMCNIVCKEWPFVLVSYVLGLATTQYVVVGLSDRRSIRHRRRGVDRRFSPIGGNCMLRTAWSLKL
jgi:hypothetical protein